MSVDCLGSMLLRAGAPWSKVATLQNVQLPSFVMWLSCSTKSSLLFFLIFQFKELEVIT